MASLPEPIDSCGLSEDEVSVVAEHEHLPQRVAARLACNLIRSDAGVGKIKRFMLDNLECATHRGEFDKASRLASLYRNFDSEHP